MLNCVDISTGAALKEMIAPGLIAIVVPLLVGIILGVEALGGMLAGALSAGVLLAIMMANGGGAWDNAKKYVEEGNYGGKGSDTHKATVVGDTVGDPFKDTSVTVNQHSYQAYDYHFTCIRSTVCTDRRITVIENNIKAGREIDPSFFHFCAINHKAAVLYI